MNKKAILPLALVISLTSMSLTPVQAADFEGKESQYIKLCSSSKLTSKQQSTCKEFNTYLYNKNKQLNEESKNTQKEIEETKDNLEKLEQQVKEIDQKIEDAQNEITYVNNNITNLNNQVEEKSDLLEDRLYAMQSSLNSNAFVAYLFNSTSMTDLFRRIMNINQITSYEQDLINELQETVKEVEKQKSTLTLLEESLKQDKESQVKLKDAYYDKLIKQNSIIEDNAAQVSENQESMESIKDNLEAIQKASDESKVNNVTQATPNKKPSKPSSNNTSKPSTDSNTNNNTNNNTDNNNSNNTDNQTDNNNSNDTTDNDDQLTSSEELGLAIANKALTRQGYMYVWGGCHSMSAIKNPNQTQFDCSGLVCWAHYQCGVNIGVQSTKYNLATDGKAVSKSDLQAGDIILFSSNGSFSGVHHVGIYIGDNKMVHAPSTGKAIQVARLDTSYWQKEWYTARRLY